MKNKAFYFNLIFDGEISRISLRNSFDGEKSTATMPLSDENRAQYNSPEEAYALILLTLPPMEISPSAGAQLISFSISDEKSSFLDALFIISDTMKSSPSREYSYSFFRKRGDKYIMHPTPNRKIRGGIKTKKNIVRTQSATVRTAMSISGVKEEKVISLLTMQYFIINGLSLVNSWKMAMGQVRDGQVGESTCGGCSSPECELPVAPSDGSEP